MDLFLPIVLFIVFCVLFSICGWCCKKHRQGTVYGYGGNPTVTVTQQAPSGINTPYPVTVAHPHPTSTPGFASTGYQTAPYPPTTSPYPPAPGGYQTAAPYPASGAAPYPTSGNTPYPKSGAAPYPSSGGAPYPATGGAAPYPPSGAAPYPPSGAAPYPPSGAAPYPPATTTGAPYPNQPPSYMEAVAQPPAEPNRNDTTYTKQAPYNPHF